MEHISSWLKNTRAIPHKTEIKAAYASFSKTTQKLLLVCLVLGSLGLVISLWQLNHSALVMVSKPGGTLVEGIIGSPRGNPLLAVSDVDRDLTRLVYSGLLRHSADGQLIPDLAASFDVSSDSKTYTFHLKKNLTWQDGKPLTASDIVFTIKKAEDPNIKSPKRVNWEGITVENPDPTTVVFTLKQPYAGFLDNTTLGILPEHLWKNVSADNFSLSELNTKPIGSGPYTITAVKKDSTGIPQYYDLQPFNNFALGRAFINIRLNLYPNETERLAAYETGAIGSLASIGPDEVAMIKKSGGQIKTAELPRIFAVFFNQNQATVFTNKEVRLALDTAIDKEDLVNKILFGYGVPLNGPTLDTAITTASTTPEIHLEKAAQILEQAGWKKNQNGIYQKTDKKKTTILAFSLATGDTPELKQAAESVQATWKKLGADVELKVFESGSLQQTVIRPRKYDALLFGQVIGQNPDLFAFWHSSQRLDPGLNIALYTNVKVDKLLEDGRTAVDINKQQAKYQAAENEIINDKPAVFLYAPYFIYVVPVELKNLTIGTLQTSGDRFNEIYKTYIETEKIWQWFAHSQDIIK